MTRKKALAHALSMPTLASGNLTPYLYIPVPECKLPPIEVTAVETFKTEAMARCRASETITAAMYAGVYLSIDDQRMQERWERILVHEGL